MDTQASFIDVNDLRIGHFVHIDLGWLSHPFPLNSFKLQCHAQIATIRELGITKVRYSPDKSDPESPAVGSENAGQTVAPIEIDPREIQKELRRKQDAALKVCENGFSDAARGYRELIGSLKSLPTRSWEQSRLLVDGVMEQVQDFEEVSIRLLSEQIGDRASQHSINVLILSLLLGKACGLPDEVLKDLGCGALLHDIGKQELPDRLKWFDEQFTSAENKLHQEHVSRGVILGKGMKMSTAALLCIAQHHEAMNGSGYPMRISGAQISPLANIVALINKYDCLCNPGNPAMAITPHEALAALYARFRGLFDANTLNAFIRMMGVYPPGSVVQLNDERYAIVVSVNSSRPLKPSLIIHDPGVPREDALIVNLEQSADLGIKRSVKPSQLPHAVFEYLSPRQRICYFFERAVSTSASAGVSP
ncbi:MAG: DUF3391 domain-containing protein [Propionivibrio sp.]